MRIFFNAINKSETKILLKGIHHHHPQIICPLLDISLLQSQLPFPVLSLQHPFIDNFLDVISPSRRWSTSIYRIKSQSPFQYFLGQSSILRCDMLRPFPLYSFDPLYNVQYFGFLSDGFIWYSISSRYTKHTSSHTSLRNSQLVGTFFGKC